jgi:mycothiol synthase
MMRLGGSIDIREVTEVDAGGRVVGYGQAAWHRGSKDTTGHWAIEIVAAPEWRDRAATTALLEAVTTEIVNSAGAQLWARADYVTDAARALQWSESRKLLQMRRPLPLATVGAVPEWLTIAPFRMSVDEGAWLEANNAAFAGHPENGNMVRRDLEHRIAQDWFDPDGLLLGWDRDRLVASCWTKVHLDGTGEIYIIGVIPEYLGRGIGRVMLEQGLDYLAKARSARTAMLYVDAANQRARRLYRQMGFEVSETLSAFSPPDESPHP